MFDERLLMKQIKEAHHPILSEILGIMNDMALTSTKKFHPKRISPFRALCIGYLLIGKSNVEATLRLSDCNLTHQISYINRNMFEIALTLYYIDDDKSKIDERVSRYFEHYNAVIRRKSIKTSNKYPAFLDSVSNDIEQEVDQNYKNYIDKYSRHGKKCNVESWSGITMKSMIESLLNDEIKGHLMKHYEIIINMFNNFLHPTKLSAELAIEEFVKGEIDQTTGLWQVKTTIGLALLIIEKHLSLFQKDRPSFKDRIIKTTDKIHKIDVELAQNYSASSSKPYSFIV